MDAIDGRRSLTPRERRCVRAWLDKAPAHLGDSARWLGREIGVSHMSVRRAEAGDGLNPGTLRKFKAAWDDLCRLFPAGKAPPPSPVPAYDEAPVEEQLRRIGLDEAQIRRIRPALVTLAPALLGALHTGEK